MEENAYAVKHIQNYAQLETGLNQSLFSTKSRTQLALDEAERNWCSSRRDLENRARDLEELQASSSLVKEKFEKKVKILGDENRRLRVCIKEKETKVSESEARAKSLSVKVRLRAGGGAQWLVFIK